MATDAEIQLSDLLEANPSSLTTNFQDLLSNRAEMAELASNATEKLEPGKFKFFNHQEFVHRFMRNYDDLLDISNTGTGKSSSAIGFFQKCIREFGRMRADPNRADKKLAHFKRVIVLVYGKTQKAEFRKQLLKTAFDNSFEVEKEDITEKSEKTMITNRIKKAGYIVKTYGKFAKEIRGDKTEKGEVSRKKGIPSYPQYVIDKKIHTKEQRRQLEAQNKDSTERLIEDFSDTLFWIDEAHNLNMEPDKSSTYKEKLATYHTIWWVFHTVLRSKRIISTATPMLNRNTELLFLLNLLLHQDFKLPPNFDYKNASELDIKTFFPGFDFNKIQDAKPEEIAPFFRGQMFFKIKEETRKDYPRVAGTPYDGNEKERTPLDIETITYEQFEPYLRGKIFYIRAAETGATPVEQGVTSVWESQSNDEVYSTIITTHNSNMSEYQNEGYREVKPLINIGKKNKDDIYTAARQLSNFRFPEVSVPRSNPTKKARSIAGMSTKEIEDISDVVENVEDSDPVIQGNFRHFIKGKGDRFIIDPDFLDEIAVNMDKYGCKYYENVNIVDTTPGNAYAYGTYVEGSGAIALAACYEARGYERFDETSSVFLNGKIRIKPAKRYGLLIGSTSESRLAAMMELMNSHENRYGDYIKVMILSRTGRDGINIDNILQIHLIGSEWNESANYQALSRGIRATSHELLLKEYQDIIDQLTDACDQTEADDKWITKAAILIYALSGGYPIDWDGTVNNDNIVLFIQGLDQAQLISPYNDMEVKVLNLIKKAPQDNLQKRVFWAIQNIDFKEKDRNLLLDFLKQMNLKERAEQLETVLKENLNDHLSNQGKLINNIKAINSVFPEKSSLYRGTILELSNINIDIKDDIDNLDTLIAQLKGNVIQELLEYTVHALLQNTLRLVKDMTTRVLTRDLIEEYQIIKRELLKKVKIDYIKSDSVIAALEIKIYKHAAIPIGNDDEGVDIMMYRKVEEKSHHIKRIEQFLHRASIGYEIFKDRNIRPTDEIQYEGPEIDYDNLDYSTYDIVYSKAIVADIMREIADIYRDHMSLTFQQLLILLPKYQLDYVTEKLKVLRNIREINQLLPIYQTDYILTMIKNDNPNLSYYEDRYLKYVLNKLQDHNINRNEVTEEQINKLFPIYRNRAMLAVIKNIKNLKDIAKYIPPYRDKYVIMALEEIITTKIPFTDKFGYTVYLRENDGFFYCTRTFPTNNMSSYSMAYYTQNIIAVKHNNMSNITDAQSVNLGNEILTMIEEKFPNDRQKIIEYLDDIPIEAQEHVLEDVIIQALTSDKNYFLIPLVRKQNFIDIIIKYYEKYIIWMHEPVDDIAIAYNEQLHPKSKQGRKRDPNKIHKDKRYTESELAVFREKMKQLAEDDTEIVYIHTLNSKVVGNVDYNATSKIAKGEGRQPILKVSEIQKGWRNLEGVEKDVYQPYIQEILGNRTKTFVNNIKGFDEYQLYGVMRKTKTSEMQFYVVDSGKESEKGKVGKKSSQSRGLALGPPSVGTPSKAYLIDILWRVKAPLPANTLIIVTDDTREEIIDKLMNGKGHKTLKSADKQDITDRNIVEEWSNEKIQHYYVWMYAPSSVTSIPKMASAIRARLEELGAIKYE